MFCSQFHLSSLQLVASVVPEAYAWFSIEPEVELDPALVFPNFDDSSNRPFHSATWTAAVLDSKLGLSLSDGAVVPPEELLVLTLWGSWPIVSLLPLNRLSKDGVLVEVPAIGIELSLERPSVSLSDPFHDAVSDHAGDLESLLVAEREP